MDTLIQAGITLPLPIGLAKQIPTTAVGGIADRERKRRRELLALDGILFMRVVG